MKKTEAGDPTQDGGDFNMDVSSKGFKISTGGNVLKIENHQKTLTGDSSPYSADIVFDFDYDSVPKVNLTGKRLGDSPGQSVKAEIESGSLDTDGCTILGSESAEVMVNVVGFD